MSSQLFAFRLAEPIEASPGDDVAGSYDPVSQTASWEGGSPILAARCTYDGDFYFFCYSYGTYCTGAYGTQDRHCD